MKAATGIAVGYARVSSVGQSLEVQREQLEAAGCVKLFEEKVSGRSFANRPELERCLDFIREGDTLVVTRLDRLARSTIDLHRIVERLQDKAVGFRCLLQPIDTTNSSGKLLFSILAAISEFETALRKERQAEGIAKAKASGVYDRSRGPRKMTPELVTRIEAALADGVTKSEIARREGIGRVSIYRYLASKEEVNNGKGNKR